MPQTRQFSNLAAQQAYETLAPVYDDFTWNHDYERWVRSLLPPLQRRGLSGNRLLDVACGTGKSFLPMLERGWEVTACDISPSMLALAQAKAGDAARLSIADMQRLPTFGEFDLVWSLGDAINYQLSFEELVNALSGMGANLADGGLLLFDVNGLACYRQFFAQTYEVERGGRRLIWRGQAAVDVAPGSICEARFDVEDPSGEDEVEPHVHRQRHHPEAEVLQALAEAGLESLDVYGHGHDAVLQQPFDDQTHVKSIHVARRGRR
ncbi:MAG TPA: class I SAM-dependent methyltransferase [Solirubrobacterales bacterium]